MREHITRRRVLIGAGGLIFLSAVGEDGDEEESKPNAEANSNSQEGNTEDEPADWYDRAEGNDNIHLVSHQFTVGNGDKELLYDVDRYYVSDGFDDGFSEIDAGGKFLVIEIIITNVGNESVDVSPDLFHIEDKAGNEYSFHDELQIRDDDAINFDQINPDLSVSGNIVFDIPNDREEVKLRIDPAGMFSTAESHYVLLKPDRV